MSSHGRWLAAVALGAALALVAQPARAQVLQVSSGATSFGPSACGDSTQPNVVDTAITLTYQYQTPSTATYGVIGTPTIELFATPDSCPSVGASDSSVTAPSGSKILVNAGTQADANSHNASLHVSDLAAVGGGCAAVQSVTWSVCFYEFYQTQPPYSGITQGNLTTSATLTYDSQPPGAPQLDDVTAGDEHLRISFTAPGDSDIASYQVLVAPSGATAQVLPVAHATIGSGSGSSGSSGSTGASGSSSGSSGSSSSSGSTGSGSGSSGSSGSSSSSTTGTTGFTQSTCLTGAQVYDLGTADTSALVPSDDTKLVNGQSYDVQLRAVDQSGNVGPCSNVISGTPQQIDDFWRLYKKDGGSGSGGCAQAGSGLALFALLGVALALLRARRKDTTP